MAFSASCSSLARCPERCLSLLQPPARQTGGFTMLALEPSCSALPLCCRVGALLRRSVNGRAISLRGLSNEFRSRHPVLGFRKAALQRQCSSRRRGIVCSIPETSTSEAETHEAPASTSAEGHSAPEQESSSPESNNAPVKDGHPSSSSSALSSLDSYFQQLAGTAAAEASKSVSIDVRPSATSSQGTASKSGVKLTEKKKTKDQEGLSALDAYFDMLNPPKQTEPKVEKPVPVATASTSEKKDETTADDVDFRKEVMDAWKKTFEEEENQQEALDMAQKALDIVIQEELSPWNRFLLQHTPNGVNTLAAISVAVYLFELASPQTDPGNFATSLPNLFGAKVNELIALGEWWRLFTPSLLHAGFFHIGISVWTMLLFGPQVEAAYGTTSFVVLYFLTGAFGNLMSFFQTQDATIGGTGPLYGMVGAWLIFLIKNREVIGKEKADNMTRQAIFLSALNVALGNPLPIDDWTHIGAALGGLLFGALAAPKLVKKPSDNFVNEITDASFRNLNEVFGGQLDYKSAKKIVEYTIDREALDYKKLALSVGVSLGLFVALLQIGVTGEMNVLPSILSAENIDFL
ncbi:Rhomboid family proteins [Klebsormidium nitens]|uniref:Rhomboid family proteins n=1 Tax=Klebsormidium nitens TaxID=105231 RepID=A0A1Y1IQV4_KLENI|nr:Rhomboid family proteins [Klebsormidium nitens]|eukprot:GAQ93084.1 Rhomboid family proteins [Klebsormidium nitens]